MEDWYQIRTDDVVGLGGRELLRHYGGSLINMLKSVYTGMIYIYI